MHSHKSLLSSTLAVVLLVLIGVWPALAQAGGSITCEPCGEECTGPDVATVTNWESNDVQRYDCLKCAVTLMATHWSWARAAMECGSTGERITLTRTRDRWEASPPGAVIVTGPQGAECKQVMAFVSREEFVKYAKKHPEQVPATPRPLPLRDFAKALAAKTAAGAAASATPGSFRDVPGDHWAQEAVAEATEAGLLTGYPDGTFRGGQGVTRYEMAMIIQRLLAKSKAAATETPPEAPAGDAEQVGGTIDVLEEPADTPSARARALVKELADELEAAGVQRADVQEALSLVANAVPAQGDVHKEPPPASFADVPPDHWASNAVAVATQEGFMEGYPDKTFRGQQELTRYEMAVVLKRLLAAIGALAAPAPPVVAEQPGAAEAPGAEAPGPEAPEKGDRMAALLAQLRAEMKAKGMSDEEIALALGPAAKAIEAQRAPGAPGTRIDELIAQLEKEMQGAGIAQDKVDAALRPLNQAVGRQAGAPPKREKEAAPPAPTAREGVNTFGQSGAIVTPSANTLPPHVGSLGYARANDASVGHAAFGVNDLLEVSLSHTSGDLPSRLLLGGKLKIYESDDSSTRVAVGVLDATDELDTTLYGVASKDLEMNLFGKPRRATVSGGIAGGLLNGLFGSFSMAMTDQFSVLGEVVDFGGATRLNYGAEYRPSDELHLKAFSAQSEFGGAISYEQEF